jgi:hypothetical protein
MLSGIAQTGNQNVLGTIQMTWLVRRFLKYQFVHQQLTLALGQNAKQNAVLHFVLRGLALDTVSCRAWAFLQANWIIPNVLLDCLRCFRCSC